MSRLRFFVPGAFPERPFLNCAPKLGRIKY